MSRLLQFIKCRRLVEYLGVSNVRYQTTESLLAKPKSLRQMMKKEKPDRLDPFAYALLIIPVSSFGLGFWQISRKKWKEDLLVRLSSRTTMEPAELPLDLSELDAMEYQPVRVRGVFDYSKEFLVGPRSKIVNGEPGNSGRTIITSSGQVGWHVVTPLKLSDRDMTILVNRGWIPNEQKDPRKRTEKRSEGEIEIVGCVRLGEKRQPLAPENKISAGLWYYRDLDRMAAMTDASPVFIDSMTSTSAGNGPVPGQTRLTLRNEHFSYILTWFSLGFCTSYMWYRQYFHQIPRL